MASYQTDVTSSESGADYWRYYYRWGDITSDRNQDAVYNFMLPDLTGATITRISVQFGGAILQTYNEGGYGNFTLKHGGTTLGTWTESEETGFVVGDLSIRGGGGQTVTLDLKHSNVIRAHRDGDASTGKSGRKLGRAACFIYYDAAFEIDNVEPLSGSCIPKCLANTFSWEQVSFEGVASQKLYWKKSTDVSYTEISLEASDTSYTFPANTFDLGDISWYIAAVDEQGAETTSAVETVTVGITPTVAISYPLGVNVKISNAQIFTWEMSEEVSTGQYSYEIQYKEAEDADWTTVTATSGNQYHSFAANTFPAGEYQWKLKVTNNDGISTSYVTATFTAIGTTDAPVITSVTNSSIPTVTWTVTSQDTFEMEIYIGSERIYASGVQVGHNVRSFTPNIILEDGNYIIKMRAMNDYGFFTPWLDYSFVLNPEKPDPLTCYAYANGHHGITVARSLELDPVTPSTPEEEGVIPSAYYVIRRRKGETEWQIIGKLSTTDESVKYDDNTVLPNVTYEYAIRYYLSDDGFADSNVVAISIGYPGYILSRGSEFVQLYLSEDVQFAATHAASKEQSYSFMIGRKYPVRESSEWISHNDSFSCFVEFAEFEKLQDFYEGNDDLWFKGKNFSYQCSIDSLSIKEALLGKGYELDISITRTDEPELRLF